MPSPLATSLLACGAVATAASASVGALIAGLGVLVELLLFVWSAASAPDRQ